MQSDAALPGLFAPYFWSFFRAKYGLLLKNDGLSRALAAEIGLRLLLFGLVQASWVLDDLFARSWRKARTRGPVFIVGHPRSGTTFLHRTLVEDATEGAHALDFGMMLLPSVLQRRLAKYLLGADTHRRQLVTKGMQRIEDRLFGAFDHLHRLRFGELEEDEYAAWSIFASVFCISDSPTAMLSPDLDFLRYPDEWSPTQRRQSIEWYRACLQKAVAASGETEGLIIGKNTAMTRNIEFTSEQFPESTFIYVVRNPLDAVASRISLVEAVWRRRSSGMSGLLPEHVNFLVNDSIELYRSAERALSILSPARVCTVNYDDLVLEPESQIRHIMKRLCLGNPKDGLSEALARRALNRFPAPDRTHQYTLSDYGIREDELRLRLDYVFEKYGFGERV